MGSNYIITPDGSFANADELYHHGILGMKWGVRRYQNSDGSLTAAGRKRYTNPDGSLNEKGKKYYAKESERLRNERKKLNTQKRTAAQLSKLDAKRKANEDLKKQLETGKKETSDADKPKQKSASEMNDNELQQVVNRLRNEDAYRDLSKKLGYDGPRTELDAQIADLEKQKRYLELQRDIKNLTSKKVSKGKQIAESIFKKVIEPAATEAGKKFLSQYLSNAVTDALKKETKKTVEDAKKSAEKAKDKQAKQEAKQETKKQAKADTSKTTEQPRSSTASKVYDRFNSSKDQNFYNRTKSQQSQYDFDWSNAKSGTVEGTGTSSKKTTGSSSSSKSSGTVFDSDNVYKGSDGYYRYRESSTTDLATTRNTSSGSNWVSRYSNTSISGLLPDPKDRDR